MNFTNTLNISPPSFLLRKPPSRVLCPKTVRNAYQTLAPWEMTSSVTNTGGQEAKARQLYNVYIIPSSAVRASSNTKWDPKSFFEVRQLFFSWPHKWGAHFGSRFGVCNGFFLAVFAESVSSFVRLTTLIVLPECLRGDLWFMFLPRVIRLTLCLPSLPGLGRCVARQQNHYKTSPRRKSDWRQWNEGPVGGAMRSVSGKLCVRVDGSGLGSHRI